MTAACDLLIVGAGPSGMAAAAAAAEVGLRVVVLDEQPQPGGQIYRGIESAAATRTRHVELLGPDYAAGLELVRAFRNAPIEYRPGTQVWQVEPDGRVFWRCNGSAGITAARRVLIAPGAMERPMPIPGWTLPGVMSCGAAQILLKGNALAPSGRFVLAGCGPLLLLLAWQLVRFGVKPVAVLETTFNRWAALSRLPGFVAAPGYLSKGLAMLRALRKAGVPIRSGVTAMAIHGTDRVNSIEYEQRGRTHHEAVDAVFLHQGVVPNGNLALSIGLAHDWDEVQRCFRPRLDAWGRSSAATVLVAGDAGGIVGARGSEYMGHLAALAAACDLGQLSIEQRDERAVPWRSALSKHRAARPFLDALYRPGQRWIAPPDPETVVCRCEEVRADEIRRLAVEQNCPGPNQMKSFVRCGMGPCQGRLCGLTVVELIAESRGLPVRDIGYYRIRPPVKPVTLGELAAIDLPRRDDAVKI